jgi:hypothetical protein
MVIRGFRPRRTARRSAVQPDRHRRDERYRPASLAGRCPGPDRRASRSQDRRIAAMALAARFGSAQSGGLIVATISAVFTIGYVANQLGEDDDWFFDCRSTCCPKAAASGSTALARMECLPSPSTASNASARSSPMKKLPDTDRRSSRRNSPACGPHRMLTPHRGHPPNESAGFPVDVFFSCNRGSA